MKSRNRENMWGWLFLSPALVLFLVTVLYPTLQGFIMSFFEWSLGSRHREWIGFANFTTLAGDGLFWKSVLNTFYYAVAAVPAALLLGLTAAMMMNSTLIKSKSLFRTIYFIPYITPLVAVSFVFRLLFHPSLGLVNTLLGLVGFRGVAWLQMPKTAMLPIIFLGIWRNFGFYMVIFLAALQGLPREVIEASLIDGASFPKRLRLVLLPLLNSTIVFTIIIGTIGSLQLFTEVVTMTGGGSAPPGGPLYSTHSVVLYIYQTAVRSLDMGYGAAMSIGLFIIMFVIILIQFKITVKPVEY